MKNNDFQQNTPPGGHRKIKKVVLAPQRKVMKSLSPQGMVLLIKPIKNNEFSPPKPRATSQAFL